MPLRINLWASPRTGSTSLMYSFAQRTNTLVVDEPLYMHYLTSISPRAFRPYRKELSFVQKSDGDEVLKDLLQIGQGKDTVFFKHLGKQFGHMKSQNAFLQRCANVILIRNPIDSLLSYVEATSSEKFLTGNQAHQPPTSHDIGMPQQLEIYEQLKEKADLPVCVVAYSDMSTRPEETLRALCAALHIPFQTSMLSWAPGGRAEDGLWAKWWYSNTHKASGFEKNLGRSVERTKEDVPASLLAVANELLPMYHSLLSHRLRL